MIIEVGAAVLLSARSWIAVLYVVCHSMFIAILKKRQSKAIRGQKVAGMLEGEHTPNPDFGRSVLPISAGEEGADYTPNITTRPSRLSELRHPW